MKIVPGSKRDWMRMASLPFVGYLFAIALVFPYWRLHTEGHPGGLGSEALNGGLDLFSRGSFICFVGLTIVAVLQLRLDERKQAMWSFIFAIVALVFSDQFTPPLIR